MAITRRDFLKYCGLSAVALGLSSTELLRLEELLANPAGPKVLWLQGAGCTGCSISLLNRISSEAPTTAADLLINFINLTYHPTLMAAAGQSAADVARQAYETGGYILAVEGGVPTAFGGRVCWAWTYNGVDVTFQQAVTDLASRAATILAIGTCASFGGVPAVGVNPAQVKSVSAITGKTTINIAGCPAHPDWIVYVVSQILAGKDIPVDGNGRPTALYGETVRDHCPNKEFSPNPPCLHSKGCRGKWAYANCPTNLWNNKVNWCIKAKAPCIACTSPDFPTLHPFDIPMPEESGWLD